MEEWNSSIKQFVSLLFSIFFFGCVCTKYDIIIQQKVLNPTSYEFYISKADLEKIVIEEFSSSANWSDSILEREQVEDLDFSAFFYLNPSIYKSDTTYFKNKTYEDHFVGIGVPMKRYIKDDLLCDVEIWKTVGLSRNVAFLGYDRRPFYSAIFIVTFDSLDTKLTKANVVTLYPKVAVGVKTVYDVHRGFWKIPIWKSVPPSTVEEYQILLRIARRLGIQSEMPELRM